MPKSSLITPFSLLYQSSGFSHKRLPFTFFLIIILAVSLSGCVTLNDPEASQDFNSDIVGTLNPGTTVGQTFISRRALLNGITIWLTPLISSNNAPNNTVSIPINVELFASPSDSTALFSTVVHISSLATSQPVTIMPKDLENSPGHSYYIQLTSGSNLVQIHGRGEDAYPHGQVYVDSVPLNADIAFRLSYEYNLETLIQDFYQVLKNIPLVVPLMLTIWLPGWLLLDISGLRKRFDLGEQVGMALGISLAAYPLLMLWTTYVKLPWSKEGLCLLTGLLVISLLMRMIYVFQKSRMPRTITTEDTLTNQVDLKSPPNNKSVRFSAFYVPMALLVIFLAALAVRLIMIRDLATPAWVDSVHHALITRLIMAQGALPSSYTPYLSIFPTDYHPGFHSIVAVFTWLSGLELTDSLLIFGQVLNASIVYSVYLFTRTLTRSSIAGLFAALIAGLLSPMPAYYTSWGRYTELAGLIILPSAFALVSLLSGAIKRAEYHWIIYTGAILSAGLFMVHYRVFAFLILLIIPFVPVYLIGKYSRLRVNAKSMLLALAAMAVLTVLFVSPWFFQSIKNTVLPNLSRAAVVPVPFFQDFSWSYLTAAMGKQSLVLAGLGLIWGAVRKERFPFLLLLWTMLLFLVANLGALRLPGGSLISNSSVEIILFIPISILGGYFLRQLVFYWSDTMPPKLIPLLAGLFVITTGLWGFFGARVLASIINPVTLLSRNADLPALEWMNENLPENETVVINPFNWGYGIYAGNDGGYWISPLTGRFTLPPPVLYGLGSDTVMVKQLVQGIINSSSDPQALHGFMQSNQLKYIFIGARGGIISPAKLMDSELFNLLYFQEDVWIFSLKP